MRNRNSKIVLVLSDNDQGTEQELELERHDTVERAIKMGERFIERVRFGDYVVRDSSAPHTIYAYGQK
jgi:hypothetical protein